MGDEAETLVAHWRDRAGDGATIDLHAEMSRVTLRIVGRLLFGADVERAVPVVAHAFPVLGEYARLRSYNPLPPPRSWPLPANRRAQHAQDAVRGVCDELIAERRALGAMGDDLLSLLIAARDGGEALDDAEIRDQVLIFLLAGHDTTAIALTFALHLLGHDRAAQERVRAEVAEVAGDRTPGAGGRRAARLHDDGAQGGDAPLPARVGARPPHRRCRRDRRLRAAGGAGRDREPVGHAPPSRLLGRRRSDSTPSASRPRRRRRATATPTSRSARGRAPASASTSRCSRRRSCWR